MASRREWWILSDEELGRQCDEDRYRASGPGGQKRNKTDSAIRLRHRPTGIQVTATESRSQHENRARALRRLRAALAFRLRQPIDQDSIPSAVRNACQGGRIELPTKHPDRLTVAAFLLDCVEAGGGEIAPLADRLGVSTASLTSFLRDDVEGWRALQDVRKRHGQRPLH